MKRKCPFSKNIIENSSTYFRTAPKKFNLTKDGLRFKVLEFNFPSICNKEALYKLYVDELKSLPDIQKLYDIDYKSILFLLKYFGIKKRTHSESQKKISSKKIKKTCLKKYGAENVLSKGTLIYQKRNKTVKEKYGVDNVFQISDVKEKIKSQLKKGGNICKKRHTTMLKKYAKLSVTRLPGKKYETSCISKFNSDVVDHLLEMGINNFTVELPLYDEDGNIFFYDICIEKTIIELHGDYWHCNPKTWNSNDIHPQKNRPAKKIWEYDNYKKLLCEKHGYDYLFIWESDYRNNKKVLNEIIKNKINNADKK